MANCPDAIPERSDSCRPGVEFGPLGIACESEDDQQSERNRSRIFCRNSKSPEDSRVAVRQLASYSGYPECVNIEFSDLTPIPLLLGQMHLSLFYPFLTFLGAVNYLIKIYTAGNRNSIIISSIPGIFMPAGGYLATFRL